MAENGGGASSSSAPVPATSSGWGWGNLLSSAASLKTKAAEAARRVSESAAKNATLAAKNAASGAAAAAKDAQSAALAARQALLKPGETARLLKEKANQTHRGFLAEKDRADQRDESSDIRARSAGEARVPWDVRGDGLEAYREEIRDRVLALSTDDRSFLCPPAPEVKFAFNYESQMAVALQLLKVDAALQQARFRLVPRKVKEEPFWRNYFYRVGVIVDAYLVRACHEGDEDGGAGAGEGGGGGESGGEDGGEEGEEDPAAAVRQVGTGPAARAGTRTLGDDGVEASRVGVEMDFAFASEDALLNPGLVQNPAAGNGVEQQGGKGATGDAAVEEGVGGDWELELANELAMDFGELAGEVEAAHSAAASAAEVGGTGEERKEAAGVECGGGADDAVDDLEERLRKEFDLDG